MLPSPDQNLKIGSVGRDFFFFFFFFFTYRERVEFSNIFFKVSKWGKLGRNAVKTHIFLYKSCKCFFKPLNTNFSKFFAQIWHKKKKTRPCFFAFYGRSGEGNITIFYFWPYDNTKIIKCGSELFILWVISYGLSFWEFRGTINDKL